MGFIKWECEWAAPLLKWNDNGHGKVIGRLALAHGKESLFSRVLTGFFRPQMHPPFLDWRFQSCCAKMDAMKFRESDRVEFGAMERKEIPEIPMDALREALVNSLCHRDYRSLKGNEIAIFEDRVEIYNPGDFPDGFQPEDFIKGKERSILRNPLIAETLFKSKEIERWGSGLKRISDECHEHDVRVEFKILKSGFLVVFDRPFLGDMGTPQKTPQIEISNLEGKVLRAIAGNAKISRVQLASMLRMSPETVKEYLEKLKRKRFLKRHGSPRTGRWEILVRL
jgi:ATP-dependent DNA helicase RecG